MKDDLVPLFSEESIAAYRGEVPGSDVSTAYENLGDLHAKLESLMFGFTSCARRDVNVPWRRTQTIVDEDARGRVRAQRSAGNAAIYVRISDDREGAGLGVQRQEKDCRALCKRSGWHSIGLYVDNDLSASRDVARKLRPETSGCSKT